jgi:hypothetical protein
MFVHSTIIVHIKCMPNLQCFTEIFSLIDDDDELNDPLQTPNVIKYLIMYE